MSIHDTVLRNMAYYQLKICIRKGISINACKAEWLRREILPYPYYHTCNAVLSEEDPCFRMTWEEAHKHFERQALANA